MIRPIYLGLSAADKPRFVSLPVTKDCCITEIHSVNSLTISMIYSESLIDGIWKVSNICDNILGAIPIKLIQKDSINLPVKKGERLVVNMADDSFVLMNCITAIGYIDTFTYSM